MISKQEWEESFYKEDKRAFKKERKAAAKRDRSKFKKTDRKKLLSSKAIHNSTKRGRERLEKGRVVTITSKGIHIKAAEGQEIVCSLKGLLKKIKTEDKNLIAVGDFVLFERSSPLEGQIVHIEPRMSILSRADNLSRRKQQLIAVNVDQVLITASLVEPELKPFLIDRYLIAASKGGMKGIILLNKIDLLPKASQQEKALYKEFVRAYRAAGCEVLSLSSETGEGLCRLREVMKGKTSVFSGQSGVGKTSLINLMTGLSMRTREIVGKTGKGAHTTTHARLIELEEGGFCIDTPGIKSFGVWNLSQKELEGYFPDIQDVGRKCHFPDCTHTHEEDCEVQQALARGEIAQVRYDSYCLLMESLGEEHLRR